MIIFTQNKNFMNYIHVFSIAILLFWSGWVNGQHVSPCLYDHAIQLREESNPGYKERLYRTIESNAAHNVNRNDEVLKVKVVLHVVYKDDIENVGDDALLKQIQVLNACYRRKNADTVNLRSIFHPVAADAGIEFELEEVRRVKTTATFRPSISGLPDDVKITSKGGSDAKDPDKYLNIWICKILPLELFGLSSPVLGYAYPPEPLDHWPAGSAAPAKHLEGVVIDYRTVSQSTYPIPNLGSIPMLARTAVHEVGHYFGLRHISGDAGLFGVNCEGTDGVDDTPTQGAQSQFNCDTSQNTCGAGVIGDLPDMIENYMDYSAETCQNTFTKGQVAIMRSVIQTLRKGLISHPSGTESIYVDNNVSIVPNPAYQFFDIHGLNNNHQYSVEIYNMMGQKLKHKQIYSNESVDVSDIYPGIYFVRIDNINQLKLMIAR